MPLVIPNSNLSNWLAGLKTYQRSHLQALLAFGGSPEAAAEKWLSAQGPDRTVSFGGAQDSKPFLDRFNTELRKFVCGESTYDADRSKLSGQVATAETTLVSAISAAIAVKLGLTATILVPPVALMLHVIGKAGLTAWCAQQSGTSV